MQGNISENCEFMKQKLLTARFGIHESSYKLAKIQISKGYEFWGIPVDMKTIYLCTLDVQSS